MTGHAALEPICTYPPASVKEYAEVFWWEVPVAQIEILRHKKKLNNNVGGQIGQLKFWAISGVSHAG
jgi:hypothetical protein